MHWRLLPLVLLPALAHGYVQGLGAGAETEETPCKGPGPFPTLSQSLQTSIRAGLSTDFSEPVRNAFSLELDVGLRAISGLANCVEIKGLFPGRRWTEHSVMVLADVELLIPRFDESIVGMKLGWNVRTGSTSSLVRLPSFFEPQFTAAVGPSWSAGRWGFGAPGAGASERPSPFAFSSSCGSQ